jgi:hypothetical protein
MLRVNVTGDKLLKQMAGRLAFVSANAAPEVKREALRQTLKIQAEAQKLTPHDGDVALRRSAQSDVTETSPQRLFAEVTFGGLAAAYAEVQHENEDFAHTEAEWAAKFGRAFPNRTMTDRKYRTEITGRKKKDGSITIGFRRNKDLKARKRKHPITGYRGGQAHFLHGADDSAWRPETERKFNIAVGNSIERALERAMREGGID